jgi:hypothetical protein
MDHPGERVDVRLAVGTDDPEQGDLGQSRGRGHPHADEGHVAAVVAVLAAAGVDQGGQLVVGERLDRHLLLGGPLHPPHRVRQVVLLIEEAEAQLQHVVAGADRPRALPGPTLVGRQQQVCLEGAQVAVICSGSSGRPWSVRKPARARTPAT